MPSSSQNAKQPNALALKQAANWQCSACGRLCRRHDELVDDFALRVGHDRDEIAAHPKRWTLHVTKLHTDVPIIVTQAKSRSPRKRLQGNSKVVLCGSCHRAYHNYRRWQQQQRQQQRQQERSGQLTLNDIRLPLTGLQLSLNEWGTPYEIVNPLPRQRRIRSPKASS
ncbi:hypothetical protein [Leptothoe spongobia]|uniref:Uncharacterized protein n=1 Tax=Leptothoe spongobia TAU-MAC 1115 TaxID=1967444 RepID=A0A947DKB1_9CYAN|nr:hypothetical protein [Leptothoe spongobia]MBT9317609.1 hypothetical protein [Leptothoe spongobia TAU-MAC 1115]